MRRDDSVATMRQISENLWLLSYPLRILGIDIRRNVSVIRLASGKLVIHSTAPFTDDDIAGIRALGEPGWVTEPMLDHDTFSEAGHRAFPDIPFLAPAGFDERVSFEVRPLDPPPSEWLPDLTVVPIEGVPGFSEHAFFHAPSGTLIVCDLLFHFPEVRSLWAKLLLLPTLGPHPAPAFSWRFKSAIKDHEAFRKSLETLLALPIQRIIPGHGEVLESDAHARAKRVFEKRGLV